MAYLLTQQKRLNAFISNFINNKVSSEHPTCKYLITPEEDIKLNFNSTKESFNKTLKFFKQKKVITILSLVLLLSTANLFSGHQKYAVVVSQGVNAWNSDLPKKAQNEKEARLLRLALVRKEKEIER